VSPSIGISIYPQDGQDIETLLKNADVAMYKAKEQGRNTFQFYAADMNRATLDRLLMESNLRRAIKKEQFVLHYQPLVSLQSGLILGVEALIRWQHDDLGMIMPDSFIRIAEETGLINPIGDWVLGEACRQAQSWIDAGLPAMVMAVNVSPVQFRQAGFVDAVAGALAASGLDANFLELEVTEGTVMHEAEVTLATLTALHRMGVVLSVDDFGTGYSSLAYLKRFPVNKLKIDRSFVRDLEVDADDRAIASTIVSMGRNLRLTVLAEGVETVEQLRLLRNMDCDMAQGYYFSRPLAAAEITELLRKQPFLKQE
jgi:diguanylate cyclase